MSLSSNVDGPTPTAKGTLLSCHHVFTRRLLIYSSGVKTLE